jgi:hypothetical protein
MKKMLVTIHYGEDISILHQVMFICTKFYTEIINEEEYIVFIRPNCDNPMTDKYNMRYVYHLSINF